MRTSRAAGAAAAVALAVVVGFGRTSEASSTFPLTVDLRATKIAADGSGRYAVIVRNRGSRRVAPITLSLSEQTVRNSSLASGSVSADVPLGTRTTKDERTYRSVLPGLAAGAGKTIAADATAAGFSDTIMTCFYALATPGDTTRTPTPTSSIPPTAGASFCEQRRVMKGAPAPLPISVELQGPADTRVGAKATYTVTVTSHARTTIRDAAIGISQQYAGPRPPLRTIPVTTDWPDTRTSKFGAQEALLAQLRPRRPVVFHVTMHAPGPLLTTSGKPIYATSFRVTASRRSLPGELLSTLLLSRLRR